MPEHLLLTILVIAGLLVAACAVMAVLGWLIVAFLRLREVRREPNENSEQSIVVADGLFELSGDLDALDRAEPRAAREEPTRDHP